MICSKCGRDMPNLTSSDGEPFTPVCLECYYHGKEVEPRMKLAYVAGSYRAYKDGQPDPEGEKRNIRRAALVASALWHENIAVICPHLNTSDCWVLNPHPEGHDAYIKGDLRMLEMCDSIYILPNWETSEGTKQELELARKLGLEINWISESYIEELERQCGNAQ